MSEFLYKRCRECREQVPPREQLITVCHHTVCRGCWAAIVERIKSDPYNTTNKCPLCGKARLRLIRVGTEEVPPPARPSEASTPSSTPPLSPREKADALIALGFSSADITVLLAARTGEDVPGYSRARVEEFSRVINDGA